jgi:hypothetical protein
MASTACGDSTEQEHRCAEDAPLTGCGGHDAQLARRQWQRALVHDFPHAGD